MLYNVGDYCKVKIYDDVYHDPSLELSKKSIYIIIDIKQNKNRYLDICTLIDVETHLVFQIEAHNLYGDPRKMKNKARKIKLKRII